jgi:hypothetical protein
VVERAAMELGDLLMHTQLIARPQDRHSGVIRGGFQLSYHLRQLSVGARCVDNGAYRLGLDLWDIASVWILRVTICGGVCDGAHTVL